MNLQKEFRNYTLMYWIVDHKSTTGIIAILSPVNYSAFEFYKTLVIVSQTSIIEAMKLPRNPLGKIPREMGKKPVDLNS